MRKAFVRMMRALMPAALGLAVASVSWCVNASETERTLTFYNIHTKETASITYKRDGEYLPEGMKQINHMMRDWRRNEPTDIDPELIDAIWEIYRDVGSEKPIHLVSGYRSKITNERLRRRGGGQARKSQHILGKAADVHFPDVPVKRLRNSALVHEAGGVGYYPKSGLPFVHVDTGRVRHWPRLPRRELAALFPDGKTKYVPSDGRPLTRRDGMIALAKLDKKIDAFIAKKSKIKLPPKMMMAGFTPPSMNWPKASPETTASIPRETPSAPSDGMRTAALQTPAVPAPTPEAKQTVIKAPTPPQIAITSLEDAEHPEELSFPSFPVLPLMGDTPVSADRRLAQFTAPGAGEEGYLLREPEGGFSASLAKGLGYTQKLNLVPFGSTKAETAQTAPRAGTKRIRTASR